MIKPPTVIASGRSTGAAKDEPGERCIVKPAIAVPSPITMKPMVMGVEAPSMATAGGDQDRGDAQHPQERSR